MSKKLSNLHLGSLPHLPRFGQHPEVDWKIIFFSALFLAFVAILGALYLFVRVSGGSIFSGERVEEQVIEAPSAGLLHRTVLEYQAKEAEFSRIKAEAELLSDPSL